MPESLGTGGFAQRVRHALTRPGAVAIVVAAAAIGIAAFALNDLAVPSGPGVGNAPASTFDPGAEGSGLIRFPIPALQIGWGIAVLAAIMLARRWRDRFGFETFADMGRGLLLVLLVAVPTLLVIQPPIRDYGGSEGAALGFGPMAYPPVGADGPTVRYVNAVSGAPFIVFFDVTNGSALPITLNGLVTNDLPGSAGPRWTGLALASVPNTFPNSMQDLRPFAPVVIPPNDRVTLYLVGKAGCTVGPSFQLDTPGASAFTSMSRDVQLGYSVLGLAATTTFTMPTQVVEPDGPPCS